MEEKKKGRLIFEDLEKSLLDLGWTEWTVIAFNSVVNEYKIFSHFCFDESDESFNMFEFILKEMLNVCEKRRTSNEQGKKETKSGTC